MRLAMHQAVGRCFAEIMPVASGTSASMPMASEKNMMKNVETPHEKPPRNPSAVLRAENTAKMSHFATN
jgi:hypothetical protein